MGFVMLKSNDTTHKKKGAALCRVFQVAILV
jgi:hypothetical protein